VVDVEIDDDDGAVRKLVDAARVREVANAALGVLGFEQVLGLRRKVLLQPLRFLREPFGLGLVGFNDLADLGVQVALGNRVLIADRQSGAAAQLFQIVVQRRAQLVSAALDVLDFAHVGRQDHRAAVRAQSLEDRSVGDVLEVLLAFREADDRRGLDDHTVAAVRIVRVVEGLRALGLRHQVMDALDLDVAKSRHDVVARGGLHKEVAQRLDVRLQLRLRDGRGPGAFVRVHEPRRNEIGAGDVEHRRCHAGDGVDNGAEREFGARGFFEAHGLLDHVHEAQPFAAGLDRAGAVTGLLVVDMDHGHLRKRRRIDLVAVHERAVRKLENEVVTAQAVGKRYRIVERRDDRVVGIADVGLHP